MEPGLLQINSETLKAFFGTFCLEKSEFANRVVPRTFEKDSGTPEPVANAQQTNRWKPAG
jgi:hypothetical protein